MGQVTEVLKRCLSYGEETEWFEYKQGTAVSKPDDRQVRTAIDFLKANGKIHREGSAKGGKWIVD